MAPPTLIYDQWEAERRTNRRSRAAATNPALTVTDWQSMKSGTVADWRSCDWVAADARRVARASHRRR